MPPQLMQNRSPLHKALVTVLIIAAACVVVFLGAIVMAVVMGVALILFLLFYIRLWWVRRRLGLDLRPRHPRRSGTTIEGEYTVEPKPVPREDESD